MLSIGNIMPCQHLQSDWPTEHPFSVLLKDNIPLCAAAFVDAITSLSTDAASETDIPKSQRSCIVVIRRPVA
jgi:hypothetical protein